MNISAKIREIQLSESTQKIQDVKKLFNSIKHLNHDVQFFTFLQIVEQAVCDNINSIGNIVSIELPSSISLEQAQKHSRSLNLGLIKGGSGTLYLSWCRPLQEGV